MTDTKTTSTVWYCEWTEHGHQKREAVIEPDAEAAERAIREIRSIMRETPVKVERMFNIPKHVIHLDSVSG